MKEMFSQLVIYVASLALVTSLVTITLVDVTLAQSTNRSQIINLNQINDTCDTDPLLSPVICSWVFEIRQWCPICDLNPLNATIFYEEPYSTVKIDLPANLTRHLQNNDTYQGNLTKAVYDLIDISSQNTSRQIDPGQICEDMFTNFFATATGEVYDTDFVKDMCKTG